MTEAIQAPADVVELAYAGLAGQAELVRSGAISARELTEAALARIDRLDPYLNAFRVVMAEEARAEATARDEARADGADLPLLGVPIAIKDEFDVAGQITTFGGASQLTPVAVDGYVTRRLREAGAVIIGKTVMPEFGEIPFTESAAHGTTRNPWDPARTPGGSSGGTAAAVASGMVAAGLGGDGGGSIRIPAACCGLYGLKAQRGRVSTSPNPDLWLALGHVGPITRTVADSALFYDLIQGNVEGDRFRASAPSMSFVEAAATEPERLRIAFSTKIPTLGVRLHPEQRAALERTAAVLRDLGHDVVEADPHYPADISAAFLPQVYGGVLEESRHVERPDLLEKRTREIVRTARLIPRRVVDWAVEHSERVAARVNRIFDAHDLLLMPSLPEPPRRAGAVDGLGSLRSAWPSTRYVSCTAVWNVCGNPAASIPAGTSSGGLPLAVQLVGRPHDEPTVLQASAQLERAQPWAHLRPPVD